jgi:alkyl sulfatase BDS1-like metallo-beta-lactamase superfamily hydrolase
VEKIGMTRLANRNSLATHGIVALAAAMGIAATPAASHELPPAGTTTKATQVANQSVAARLPLEEQTDFENARRGFLARIEGDAIRDAQGRVIWPIKDYAAFRGPAPDSVNPSLWRQAQLVNMQGLFEVMDGIYQVRGYDVSVMTVIRGETGWIVVDPLLSAETAAAALDLVNRTLGERPVTGIIYSHSHGDHFGGVRGVIDEGDARARAVPIIAPNGFTAATVAENLMAGNAMTRRAELMFGNHLPIDAQGQVSMGLGPGLSSGTIGLIQPTEELGTGITQRTIDGIVFDFVDAGETEAPAEFMFYLPQFNALCTTEVVTTTMHNALTLRGARIRDLARWSEVIDEVLQAYGTSDVVFASHGWPTWGGENVTEHLRSQRDTYRYVHDQTLRLMNQGQTMTEIAENIEETPDQQKYLATRGYYGTMNHNSKAVYQAYLGWWDGIPANYFAHPAEERAKRFAKAMGGMDKLLAEGRRAFEAGDYRWSADVFNNAVFSEPGNGQARAWLAASYEQLGFQSESGAWRAYFLSAAHELRQPKADGGKIDYGNPGLLGGVPSAQLFRLLSVRYNPAKLEREPFLVAFVFPGEVIEVEVNRQVAFARTVTAASGKAAAVLIVARPDFDALILRRTSLAELLGNGRAKLTGDAGALDAYFGALEAPTPGFNVVEP